MDHPSLKDNEPIYDNLPQNPPTTNRHQKRVEQSRNQTGPSQPPKEAQVIGNENAERL